MKRDSLPSTPGLAAPQKTGERNTRAMFNTALQALLQREYSVNELAEHVQERHPERHLCMANLVERLVQLGEIEIDGTTIGLTDEGERVAARNGARPVDHDQRGKGAPSTEAERRTALLIGTATSDPFALTRGIRRTAASSADLADPPMRPGAQACIDLPSRIGDRLHYRDGRIATMDGIEVQPARPAGGTRYKATRDGSSRATPAWSRDY